MRHFIKLLPPIFILCFISFVTQAGSGGMVIEKEFTYDKYTLEDSYPYRDTVRIFQWDKIREQLSYIETIQRFNSAWGVLKNKRNANGTAAVVTNSARNEYGAITDQYGVERHQGTPVYTTHNTKTPERYGRDGALVKVIADSAEYVKIESIAFEGEWMVPKKFIKKLETQSFPIIIFVDRTNQNIATIERVEDRWLVRSMNPATTGLRRPPYQYATPLGIFVLQEQREKMFFYVDGTTTIGGFAPYASRFSNGGYIHGVPVNYPSSTIIEYSPTLGTTPRSHMCVRNATSHAKFIFDWATVEQTLVVVIE